LAVKWSRLNNLQAVQDYLQQQSAQGHEVVNGLTGIYPTILRSTQTVMPWL
jgi:hypothetical protein